VSDTRECEFCRDRLEEFAEDAVVCGACDGTRLLGVRECFCHAYEPSECGCEADWSDYTEIDYWEDEE
jgi:hypothetical protein